VTPYHAKYFAYDLTLGAATGIEKLSIFLFDAAVDLNPHQIEAATFALQSPISKGVIVADEVGLGKSLPSAPLNPCFESSTTTLNGDPSSFKYDHIRWSYWQSRCFV
jgi:hypothetical protein